MSQVLFYVRILEQPGQCKLNGTNIQCRGQAITLGRRQERLRIDNFAVWHLEPQQHLATQPIGLFTQWLNLLPGKSQAIFFQSRIDLFNPTRCNLAITDITLALAIDNDSVTPLVLGNVAS